jgi:hypothetical protein
MASILGIMVNNPEESNIIVWGNIQLGVFRKPELYIKFEPRRHKNRDIIIFKFFSIPFLYFMHE